MIHSNINITFVQYTYINLHIIVDRSFEFVFGSMCVVSDCELLCNVIYL